MLEIDKKIVICISGMPNNGKTTLGLHLFKNYKNSIIIHADCEISDFIYNLHPNMISDLRNIQYMYDNILTDKLKSEFLDYLHFHILTKLNIPNVNFLILEGYITKFYIEKYENELKDKSFLFNIIARNKKYRINDIAYIDISDVANKIKVSILSNVLPRITYQHFEDLNKTIKNSNSYEKFNRLNITDKLNDKIFMDLGCNTGYFCLRAISYGAKYAVGVDLNTSALEIASILKNGIYEYNNVKFISSDIFDVNEKADIILCASTFHYFREKQILFLEKYYNLLNKDGILVLECGTSEKKIDEIYVELYSRNIDPVPCHYPNKKTLISMAESVGFSFLYYGDSVKQPGDSMNRKVYHFIKK